jgi:hypothetical protein
MDVIIEKLENIEKEIKSLKELLRGKPRKSVSLRGMAKPLVPEQELENAIKEAKKALLGAKDVSD